MEAVLASLSVIVKMCKQLNVLTCLNTSQLTKHCVSLVCTTVLFVLSDVSAFCNVCCHIIYVQHFFSFPCPTLLCLFLLYLHPSLNSSFSLQRGGGGS